MYWLYKFVYKGLNTNQKQVVIFPRRTKNIFRIYMHIVKIAESTKNYLMS